MKKLGFGAVRKSTLADANQKRPLEILEDIFGELLKVARRHAPGNGFTFPGKTIGLDASVISLSLKLMPWAQSNRCESSVKLHTALDLAGDLPDFVVIGPGDIQDMKMAKQSFSFKKGTTIICDKGYSEYKWYSKLHEEGVFFVTRQKDYARHRVVRSRKTDRTRGYLCDQEIYIDGRIAKEAKLPKLRRISFRDPATKKKLVFLTNRFDLTTETICDLYKARWRVELFFKTLKQNLKIKKFLGTTPHAVKAQIWVALIAYLMIQILRFTNATSISVPDTMAVIGVLLLLREPLSRLLGRLPKTTRYPRDRQMVLNF